MEIKMENYNTENTPLSKHDKEMMAQDFSSLEELSEWEDGWQKK